MRKTLVVLVLFALVMVLTSCVEASIDNLKFNLNPSVDTVEVNSEFIDQGATASYGLRELDVEIISNNVDTTKIGVYEIVYYTKYLSFEKTLKRIVTVVNEEGPEVVLNAGLDTIFVGESWIDAGVTSDEEVDIVVLGFVDVNTTGEYVISYEVTDQFGFEIILYRYVNVIE
jgi:hypothetical protein